MGLADLLDVAKKLVTVLNSASPCSIELASGGLALNDEKPVIVIVPDEDIGAASARAVAELPFWLKLNVSGLIPFHKESMNAFKDNEIFLHGEITGLAFVGFEISRVAEFSHRKIYLKLRPSNHFGIFLTMFRET